jgi:hypothetical protein
LEDVVADGARCDQEAVEWRSSWLTVDVERVRDSLGEVSEKSHVPPPKMSRGNFPTAALRVTTGLDWAPATRSFLACHPLIVRNIVVQERSEPRAIDSRERKKVPAIESRRRERESARTGC